MLATVHQGLGAEKGHQLPENLPAEDAKNLLRARTWCLPVSCEPVLEHSSDQEAQREINVAVGDFF